MTESNCNCNSDFFFLGTRTWLLEVCDGDPPNRDDTADDDEFIVSVLDTEKFDAGFDPKGLLGAFADIGGKVAFEVLVGDFVAFGFAPNGLLGALFDMGGNATFAVLTGVFAGDFVPNGLFGAFVDMVGKAAFEVLVGAFVAIGFAPNGLFGALFDMGGNAAFAVLAGAFVGDFAPNGLFGAFADIGGKAAFAVLIGAFAVGFAPNGLLGAFFDMGGNAVFELPVEGPVVEGFTPNDGAFPAVLFPIALNGLLELTPPGFALNAVNGLLEGDFSAAFVPNEANALVREVFAPNGEGEEKVIFV
jgi:hypothetical protein